MAKREQGIEENMGLITQVQAEYRTIMEEVRSYCQKARELWQQAEDLRRSGSTDPQVATEISKLLEPVEYYIHLQIRRMDILDWKNFAA